MRNVSKEYHTRHVLVSRNTVSSSVTVTFVISQLCKRDYSLHGQKMTLFHSEQYSTLQYVSSQLLSPARQFRFTSLFVIEAPKGQTNFVGPVHRFVGRMPMGVLRSTETGHRTVTVQNIVF